MPPTPAEASSSVPPDPMSTEAADVSARQVREIAASGVECDVQMLYPGPPKCECCTNWVEEYPEDLRSTVEQQEESKRKALVVRMGIHHGEGKTLALDSIVVQNQHIKDLLGDVFHGYGGITTDLKKLVFRAPFHAFYHRWDRFHDLLARQKQEDAAASAYSQLLYNIVEHELREPMEEARDLCSKGVMTYGLLWTIFQPGARIYSSINGLDRFFVVQSSHYSPASFDIIATHTDWDGTKFGWLSTCLTISRFAGTKKVTDLSVHPTSSRADQDTMEEALRIRGEKLYNFRGVHYRAYRASCLLVDRNNRGFKSKQVNGRIVIDYSLSPSVLQATGMVALDHPSVAPKIDVSDKAAHPHHAASGPEMPPDSGAWGWDGQGRVLMRGPAGRRPRHTHAELPPHSTDKRTGTASSSVGEKPPIEPSSAHFMLTGGHVRGYSMADKCWGLFDVDSVEDIKWNMDAFPSLRLPAGHKDLILAFVDGQLSKSQPLDDFIEAKDLGLTMLLVGSPGTGKTLTAEAIADRLQKPLYTLSAGELGQEAESLEHNLGRTLQMTEKWGAILLLDECDVFLEKRSHSNLGHNEVVAVFLRTLEYYPGMLFLTTNRGDAIDKAFESRIHLTLRYPELSTDAKYHIWEQFLSRAASSALDPLEMSKLANLSLNGRQIKNIVKTASLLARSQASPSIQVKHIETVLEVTNQEGLDNGDADNQDALSDKPM